MMRFKAKVAHKFAESPLLELRLPAWRSRLMALLILFSFVVSDRPRVLPANTRHRLPAGKGRVALPARHRNHRLARTHCRPPWRRSGHFDADEVDLGSPAGGTADAEQTRQLAALLETDAQALTRKLTTDKPFVFLRRQIPPPVAAQVAALKLPGIGQDQGISPLLPDWRDDRAHGRFHRASTTRASKALSWPSMGNCWARRAAVA
jgi:cell division protein FtsI (penicillin-binding protein 3)